MEQVTIRTGLTSRGISALSQWAEESATYSILKINLGSNPITNLKIVSLMNSIYL